MSKFKKLGNKSLANVEGGRGSWAYAAGNWFGHQFVRTYTHGTYDIQYSPIATPLPRWH